MNKSLVDVIRAYERVLTAAEVQALLGIHESIIYKFAKQNRIPGFRIGERVCFDSEQLADWYEERQLSYLRAEKGDAKGAWGAHSVRISSKAPDTACGSMH